VELRDQGLTWNEVAQNDSHGHLARVWPWSLLAACTSARSRTQSAQLVTAGCCAVTSQPGHLFPVIPEGWSTGFMRRDSERRVRARSSPRDPQRGQLPGAQVSGDARPSPLKRDSGAARVSSSPTITTTASTIATAARTLTITRSHDASCCCSHRQPLADFSDHAAAVWPGDRPNAARHPR
jgi:hypothetical protein